MPSWTTMTDRSAGDVISEADWDAFQGNIEYLLNPNADLNIVDNSGEYSTTNTSFEDIHATDFACTITTNGGPALVYFIGTNSATTGPANIRYDIDVDGTRHGNAFSEGMSYRNAGATDDVASVMFAVVIDSLSAGSHTFKMQWKVDANQGDLYSGTGSGLDIGAFFGAIEI